MSVSDLSVTVSDMPMSVFDLSVSDMSGADLFLSVSLCVSVSDLSVSVCACG